MHSINTIISTSIIHPLSIYRGVILDTKGNNTSDTLSDTKYVLNNSKLISNVYLKDTDDTNGDTSWYQRQNDTKKMKEIAIILNKSVSVFSNVKNVNNCKITTVGRWLHGCMNPQSKLIPLIEQIRNEPDKKKRTELKTKVPGVTLGATLKTRAANVPDKITALTGLICFDIDPLDNPGMNPAALREKLSLNRNVIFAGLSVSGLGVWGLVEVKHTDKIKQHFYQLKADFIAVGIKLDVSKGGNPTDLRFYSYDPDAYLSESYKVYKRLPQPIKKQRRAITQTTNSDMIQVAVNMVLSCADGEKHNKLLKAAKLLGGYIGGGQVSEPEARQALEAAISSRNISSFTSAQNTIRDGLRYGMASPIYSDKSIEANNVADPLFTYFENLDPDSFEEIIIVDDLPLELCVKTWVKEAKQNNSEAYLRLKLLRNELL